MSEVFISYARPAEAEATRIAETLRSLGFGVWRDDELPPHRAYADVIEERLRASKAVVVLWTADAVRSQWVRAEADLARGAGKLVQIALEGVALPLPFNQIQCANLAGWAGETDAPEWCKIAASITELIGKAPEAPAEPFRRPGAGVDAGRREPARGALPRLSIVVLPFVNLSHDPEQAYFVDGVTESLTTDLSRIHGSFVIARNTAFTFAGRDAKEVGRSLGVRYVLEGSVQRGGDRLRVNVQLIDAASGAHLWSERFDKQITDLFEMQDEIVTRLARALDVQLVAAEARQVEHAAVDADAMDLYFQGQAVVNQGFGPEGAVRARELWLKALELSPDNVDVLAALATRDALAISLVFTPDGGWASFAQAEKWAIRAIELAPDLARGHEALARVLAFTNRVDQSLSEYRHALRLDRNCTTAYAGFAATKMYGGHPEEAETEIQNAFRLSPRDAEAHLWCLIAGASKLLLGEDAAAEAWFRRGIEFNRSYPIQVLYLAGALAGLGRMDEAKATMAEALTLNPRFSISLIRTIRRSTNPTYMRQLDGLLGKLKAAGAPD